LRRFARGSFGDGVVPVRFTLLVVCSRSRSRSRVWGGFLDQRRMILPVGLLIISIPVVSILVFFRKPNVQRGHRNLRGMRGLLPFVAKGLGRVLFGPLATAAAAALGGQRQCRRPPCRSNSRACLGRNRHKVSKDPASLPGPFLGGLVKGDDPPQGDGGHAEWGQRL